jgi:predicted RNase H-like nuclease (RuvC/YqgF family)
MQEDLIIEKLTEISLKLERSLAIQEMHSATIEKHSEKIEELTSQLSAVSTNLQNHSEKFKEIDDLQDELRNNNAIVMTGGKVFIGFISLLAATATIVTAIYRFLKGA